MVSANFGSHRLLIGAAMTITILSLDGNTLAQIASDNTTKTEVRAVGDLWQITGGVSSGQNLFHSFQEFSLTTDAIANFVHGEDVANIFSRVTGANVSEIDGTIATQGQANLFLLNPAGIVFGANARLNVGGSFIATTSDRLIFEDGSDFSATITTEEPLLTISSPVGLQYGNNPGSIEVLPNANRAANDSGLSVSFGKTLALLGGDVSMSRNSLNAVGSNIEIGSSQKGMVSLEADNNSWEFNYDLVENFGKIELNDRALINSSGRVNFQGKTIQLSSGSGIRNFTIADNIKSTINLTATEAISLDNSLLLTQLGQQRMVIPEAIASTGGDITLKAPQISFNNGSVVSAGTLGAGTGGNIAIEASDTVELLAGEGNPSIISTSTRGTGNGGQIEIDTGKLTIADGSQVQALAGEGVGGTITIRAREAVELVGTGSLRSRDERGNVSQLELASGLSASSGIEGLPLELQPRGDSGSLKIYTPNLKIAESAQISVSNYGLSNGGDIEIATTTLDISTAGAIVANTASGAGGSINIVADKLIVLDSEGSISTTADRSGDGGNIFLETANLALLEANRLTADAKQGNGGKIAIATQGLFVSSESSITASSEIEQQQGSVEISTLNLDSRIETNYKQRYSFIGEEQIATGCGVVDTESSRFSNIGRGGIPSSLLQETFHLETLADLGEGNSNRDSAKISSKTSLPQLTRQTTNFNHKITEANTWFVNERGAIELVADRPTILSPASCNSKK